MNHAGDQVKDTEELMKDKERAIREAGDVAPGAASVASEAGRSADQTQRVPEESDGAEAHATTITPRILRLVYPLALLFAFTGCDRIWPERADLTLPDTAVVASYYERHGFDAEFRYSGNVLEVVVQQPPDQLRRGGALWARVGPYIYLFAPATRDLLEQYHGIAGVRAITMVGSVEVARALLVRDELNEVTWPRAINILGAALEQGTERPSTMDALARFGEEHTTYQYNPAYVPPRQQARNMPARRAYMRLAGRIRSHEEGRTWARQ